MPMKRNNPDGKYEKMASVSRIKDNVSRYKHHNIYPDKKLGFVCIQSGTKGKKILATDMNKRKCEEKARYIYLLFLVRKEVNILESVASM